MADQDQAKPTQSGTYDKSSQQGSGDLTGATDQGGSGQTSEPRQGQQGQQGQQSQQGQDAGYAGASQSGMAPKTAGRPQDREGQDVAQDPKGSTPTSR